MSINSALHHRGVVSLLSAVGSGALAAGVTWAGLQGRIQALESKAERSDAEAACVRVRLESVDASLKVIANDVGWVKETLRDLRDGRRDRFGER